MSELYREKHPLLCDEFSDDEFNPDNYSPRTNPRMKPVICSGRAKIQMKGVTAILRNWPEYWWSSFKYLWMGLGMIAIIVLIVYNSVVALSMLPPTYMKMLKPQTSYNSVDNILSEKLSTYGIYMHIFTKTEDKVNLDDFLPYIEIMCKKYKNFKFNLIVVTHETFKTLDYINDEINNDVALNMLWTDKSFDNDYKFTREYWWSSFKYLWMGLGMIAIIVLIVYNSVVALSMLPPTYMKMLKPQTSYNSVDNILSEKLSTYGIYMHIFTKTEDKVNLDDFLPYIEIMCKKYKNFKFNLIVVTHETFKTLDYINDEINNDVALNMLWTDKSFDNDYKFTRGNLAVSYVSLNKYLKNPMLQKISNKLSNEFIEFLVRAFSIWEKGGLAFNPIILTPKSPNPFYVEKIQNLLNMKKHERKTNEKHKKELQRPKKTLNNIRDIIDALEIDDRPSNNLPYNLTEVEDKFYKETVNNTNVEVFFNNDSFSDLLNLNLRVKNYKNTKPLVASGRIQREINKSIDRNFDAESNSFDNVTMPHLLPIFLQYLLPKKESLEADKKSNIPINLKNYQPDIVLSTPNEISNENSDAAFIKNKNPDLFQNNEIKSNWQDYETDTQLTIDLKGNLIASNTACHALVGNFLSNAVYHNEEKTLTDFIIAELTVFCKGVISSCKGIDVILS